MSYLRPIKALLPGLTRFAFGTNARWLCPQHQTVQRVYFANHTSHLDTLLLWSLLPADSRSRTRPVVAKEYWNSTCFRRLLANDVFNAIMIERPDHAAASRLNLASQALSGIMENMADQYSIIIFPEGTRGDKTEMRPFKSGIYHLARKRPDLEFIPVYLENLNRILPKGELLPLPLLGSVSFGVPLQIQPDECKPAFLLRARKAIEEMKP